MSNTRPPLAPLGVHILDPNQGRWIRSLVEMKWHLVNQPCPYTTIIREGNQDYDDSRVPDGRICWYCKQVLLKGPGPDDELPSAATVAQPKGPKVM